MHIVIMQNHNPRNNAVKFFIPARIIIIHCSVSPSIKILHTYLTYLSSVHERAMPTFLLHVGERKRCTYVLCAYLVCAYAYAHLQNMQCVFRTVLQYPCIRTVTVLSRNCSLTFPSLRGYSYLISCLFWPYTPCIYEHVTEYWYLS